MSSATAIESVNMVKKKLEKYTALKEYGKVKEYLHKLHKTSVTPSLLQETRVDQLVRQLASHQTASYRSLAKSLVKKWEKRQLISKSKPIEMKKVKETNVESNVEKLSESQLIEEKKPRKVLSLTQYLQSQKEKLNSEPKSTQNLSENKLSDEEIQVINAQFNAATEQLAVNASDLAVVVDKTLKQSDKIHQQRPDPLSQMKISSKTDPNDDLWTEVDDDDDEINDNGQPIPLINLQNAYVPELW